jgi:diphthamide biosynthesis protein 2
MQIALSSDAQDVMTRTIEIVGTRFEGDWLDYYDVEGTVAWIKHNGWKRVALQFPDDWLDDSTRVQHRLARDTGVQLYVLADTSYGSCCVDEVAAQHVDADALVHYGHSCLSK